MNLVDPNGRRVLTFTSHIQNLGRVAELTDAVIDIATSGAWRDYHMATGHEAWREAELDYFLIACGMHYEDVSRVLAYNAGAKALAPMMDKTASTDRRRPLAEAATVWHSPTGESLLDRAKHLGWLRDSGVMRASPIPERARAQAKHGMTLDEHARESRRQRIPVARRRQLDAIAKRTLGEIADDTERRYLIDRLARDGAAGRPAASEAELERWRADAERLDWKAPALAEHWGIARESAYRRIKRLRESTA
jgi:hypothetical protein